MRTYYLTRSAALDFKEIYIYSLQTFGKITADEYVDTLFVSVNKIINNPSLGNLRKHRATPFLMIPAGQHFIIYKNVKKGVIIAAILHNKRNIEAVLAKIVSELEIEIAEIENKIN